MAQKASTKSKSRPSSYAPAQIQTCPAIVAGAFGPSLLVPHSEKCMYVARALAHTPLLLLELARATLLPVSVVGPNCCLSMMTKQRHECSDKTERSPAPAADMGAAPTAALLAKATPCKTKCDDPFSSRGTCLAFKQVFDTKTHSRRSWDR